MKKQQFNLQDIIDKLGFDPRDADEMHKYLRKYYKLKDNPTLDEELSYDESMPNVWSRLTLEEKEWLEENDLLA